MCFKSILISFIGFFLLLISINVKSINNYINLDVNECLLQLRSSAEENGISLYDFDRFTSKACFINSTIEASKQQSKKQEDFDSYVLKMINKKKIIDGKKLLIKYNNELNSISNEYGIDPEVLISIFGIETNYGSILGNTNVLNAWLTRTCNEQNPLWKKNFYASIKILRDGIVKPEEFLGSWSGAFGLTQFIPTSFYELAVDWDKDGIADLYNSVPDALASTANHLLKRNVKWVKGNPSIIEITIPKNITNDLININNDNLYVSKDKHSIDFWSDIGITTTSGEKISSICDNIICDEWFIIAPSGYIGPKFLANSNFNALLKYNKSYRYALVVSLLANELKDINILKTSWLSFK